MASNRPHGSGMPSSHLIWFNLASLGTKADYSLFTMHTIHSFTTLHVNVDEIIVASTSLDNITALKSFLHAQFCIKDLGTVRYFFGIGVARSPSSILLCQRKYALNILADTSTLGSKPLKLPMEHNTYLSRTYGISLPDPTVYKRLIGRLLYLTITRLDLSYSIQILTKFMDQSTNVHLAAAHRVLRYIHVAPARGILFPPSSSCQLHAYCDSD